MSVHISVEAEALNPDSLGKFWKPKIAGALSHLSESLGGRRVALRWRD